MIYVGKRYTATVDGSIYKKVICENCRRVYYYQMSRRAQGEGDSPYYLDNTGASERATERAQRNLERRLAKGSEPVACPDCGRFQAHMIRIIRSRRFDRLYWLIFGLPVVALLAATLYFGANRIRPEEAPLLFATLISVPVLLGAACWVYRWRLWHAYDPNNLKSGDADPSPSAPDALDLINEPSDFERSDVRLRFSRAWPSSAARHHATG
jgi:hypothetical protein